MLTGKEKTIAKSMMRHSLCSQVGREPMYERHGFTTEMYSTMMATAHPISVDNQLASGNLTRTCDQNQITVAEFDTFTEEIHNFDNQLAPLLRNIKWFLETAEIRLLARNKQGKLTC